MEAGCPGRQAGSFAEIRIRLLNGPINLNALNGPINLNALTHGM